MAFEMSKVDLMTLGEIQQDMSLRAGIVEKVESYMPHHKLQLRFCRWPGQDCYGRPFQSVLSCDTLGKFGLLLGIGILDGWLVHKRNTWSCTVNFTGA